jgi:hypothetical protein
METAKSSMPVKKGYMNFDLALGVVYECRTLIDQETEDDAVVGHLKKAAVALADLNGGDAAPCVKAAIRSIGEIVDKVPD